MGSLIYYITSYLPSLARQAAMTFCKLLPIFETQLETAYCNCMTKTRVMPDTALARLQETTSRNTKSTEHRPNCRAKT